MKSPLKGRMKRKRVSKVKMGGILSHFPLAHVIFKERGHHCSTLLINFSGPPKTPTAIKPIAQQTKNPITTTTIHKFNIAKTQTQQQFTNSTHNNIPKTHWIQHPNIPKINQQKHTSTSHRPNPFYRRRNPKPKAKPISPLEAEQPKFQTPNNGVNEAPTQTTTPPQRPTARLATVDDIHVGDPR